jgi:hypothetical protein
MKKDSLPEWTNLGAPEWIFKKFYTGNSVTKVWDVF